MKSRPTVCCICVWMCECDKYCVTLIVPALTLCSTAITFTAQLASDYLSLTHRNTNTEILADTHTALFAYCFYLEIVILVIRRIGNIIMELAST